MSLRDIGKQVANHLPKFFKEKACLAEELARGFVTGGTLFEELGFYYVGIVDGHDLGQLLPVLENMRNADNGPFLVHVRTQKGKGYAPAEASKDKYHGVVKFDVATGKQHKGVSNAPSYTKVFGEALVKEAAKDDKIVAITAAMPGGTGVDIFAKAYPDRSFDVGIAEQHGVTFAAGLATQGYKPFVAIYSTFLQRAYDQVVHDVAIQQLPVRFILDRAGLVGADGPTHAGSFDLAYLGCLPGFVIMAAADKAELVIWSLPQWRSMITPRPCATRAATAWASSCPSKACLSKSGKAGSLRKAARSPSSRSARGLPNASRRQRRSRRMEFQRPSRMHVSLNRSIANSSFSLRASMNC